MSIYCAQSVRFERWITELKNYFKQIQVPCKIYANFKCNLKNVENYEGFHSRRYQDHIPCSFAYKLVCVDDKFTKPILVFRGENSDFKFIEAILKDYEHCKKAIKKQFKKKFDHEQKKNSSNQVTLVGYVKNALIMTMKKLEIIVT